jgi:HAD superfamily phosphatase (TIGR01668 family)
MGLIPTLRYKRICNIPLDKLKELNIKLILLDMDNTVALWRASEVSEETTQWVKRAKEEGFRVALFTNSKGMNADTIGKNLDIEVFKNAKKPFKAPTKKLLSTLGIVPENVLMVGDQLFTDIQLANSVKAKSVLLEPLSDYEWWCTKVFNRSREKLVWKFLFK